MKDVNMSKKPHSRQPLTDDKIKKCHDLIDELVRLYKATDPALGEKSEDYKADKAYQAINHIGMISAILTEWAEAQVIGSYYQIAKSKEKWIDDATSNLHENELMWYGELPESVFTDDEYLACNRSALAAIIRNSFRLYGITGWRMGLSESLQALNDGQVDWLLTPTNTKLQGYGYELSNLKWVTVKHVYRLMGEGWKKTAAQQKVAECCGTTFEAIKKWERQGIKERDKKKVSLKGILKGSTVREICRKAPKHDEQEFLIYAVNRCVNTDIRELKDAKDRELRDLFCDITFCYRLEQEYPLETLKVRLIDAGMRKAR